MDDEQAARAVAVQLRRTAGYLARAEIERLLEPLRAHPKRLEPFGYKVYSQNDEDGILSEIFSRLKMAAGLFWRRPEAGCWPALAYVITNILIRYRWAGKFHEADRYESRQGRMTAKSIGIRLTRKSACDRDVADMPDTCKTIAPSRSQSFAVACAARLSGSALIPIKPVGPI